MRSVAHEQSMPLAIFEERHVLCLNSAATPRQLSGDLAEDNEIAPRSLRNKEVSANKQ